MRIYFDNAATTPIHPDVVSLMSELMSHVYGNPSSIHNAGRKARTIIEEARKAVANELKASIGEIFFTSSATEANNMILRKAVDDLGVRHIIISSIEHPCVMETAKDLSKNQELSLDIIPVDRSGKLDLRRLENSLQNREGKKLVSVMHVNNEIGVIQDLQKISTLCHENNALFHCDAVQSIGKMDLNLNEVLIDFLSATSHKFHGPKGIGFMFIKNDYSLHPFITGGGQEREMRSGTENVYGIAGLAKALKLYGSERENKMKHILELKNKFKEDLKKAIPEVSFIEDADTDRYIPTILSVSFPETPKTELMTFNLDIAGIAASAGSACSSGVEHASHVLEAISFPEDRRAVRFSFSYFNTKEEVESSIEKIAKMF